MTRRVKLNLTILPELIAEAHDSGINISKFLENKLIEELGKK